MPVYRWTRTRNLKRRTGLTAGKRVSRDVSQPRRGFCLGPSPHNVGPIVCRDYDDDNTYEKLNDIIG
mgnify:CR=1 FL=1